MIVVQAIAVQKSNPYDRCVENSRLVLLSLRSLNFELESEVNKNLRLFRNIGAQSSGDYSTGLN